jgi:hypothetical protein
METGIACIFPTVTSESRLISTFEKGGSSKNEKGKKKGPKRQQN